MSTTLPEMSQRYGIARQWKVNRRYDALAKLVPVYNAHMLRLGWPMQATIIDTPDDSYLAGVLVFQNTETGEYHPYPNEGSLEKFIGMLEEIPDFTDFRLWPVFLSIFEQGECAGYNG